MTTNNELSQRVKKSHIYKIFFHWLKPCPDIYTEAGPDDNLGRDMEKWHIHIKLSNQLQFHKSK